MSGQPEFFERWNQIFWLSKQKNAEAIPHDLHFSSGTESLFFMIRTIIQNYRIEVPDWIIVAVNQIMHAAFQEGACVLPGHIADLSHGHLLISPDLKDAELTQQLEESKSILFHSQECIDAKRYRIDPKRRNIYFDRDSGTTKILNVDDFLHNEEYTIDPNNISTSLVAGGTIFFEMLSTGEIHFASWDR